MKEIKTSLYNIDKTTFDLGYVGEKNHTRVVINCVSIFKIFPNAVATMTAKPPVGDLYPVVLTREGVSIIWDIAESDIANAGVGQYQLTFTNGSGDSAEIIKTVYGNYSVKGSLAPTGSAPTPIENWIDEANEILDEFGEVTNMTASAETVAAGASAEATVSKVDGHFNINFKIPRGASGNETIDDTAGIGDTDKVWSADKDAKEISDLKSAKAPIIMEAISTPADVQTFPDGADGMPVKTLTVGIDPVQDLHGYDNPWPAGGGKNLLNPEYRDNLSNNIQFYKDAGYLIKAGVTYTLSISGNNANGLYFVRKSDDSNLIAAYNNTYLTYTATEDTLVYFNIYYSPVPSGGLSSINCQLEIGSTTTYAPYSNICPITGHTGANVSRTGKNLVGITLSQAGDNNVLSNVFSLKAGTYTLSVKYNGIPTYGIYLRNGNNASSPVIVQQYNANTLTFTLEHDYEELCFSMYYGQGITPSEVTEIQIEQGSTASSYAEYHGSTTEYEFPEAAGTVYGGTLTIHQDGSGELVVDRASKLISELGMIYQSSYPRFYTDSLKTIIDTSKLNEVISDTLEYSNSLVYTKYILHVASSGNLFISYPSADSVTALNNAIGSTKIVYPLATPVTYQLTNQQVIQLLSFNNIWADTGKINAVDYPADTKLYIDKKLTELQALVLEN